MKKNIFAIDFTKNTISASKSALKKASNPNTDEHTELMNLLALHPTFKVCEKAPNTKKTIATAKVRRVKATVQLASAKQADEAAA